MAEAGLVFSILGLAAEGLKISETISAFIDRVGSASKDIQAIVTDVQSTSKTLQKLADCLGNDGNSNLANEEWKSSTEAHLSTCSKIFSEIQSTISNHSASQLESDTKFSRLKRFKVAFKHERVVGWKVKLASVKTDFSFKINVLNLARHEKERQTERTHLRKKAELDRLDSKEDVEQRTGETVGGKHISDKAVASQPVSERKHESRPTVAKHGLVARRRRQRAQTRGLRRQSSLRFDLVSSTEALLSRKLAGTVDRNSLQALIHILQQGKANVERLETCSASSTTLKKEATAGDSPREAKGAVLEHSKESGRLQESGWNSEDDGSSANENSDCNAQATKLETLALSRDETAIPVSLHGSTTLNVSQENVALHLGSESKRMQCNRTGRPGTSKEPKRRVITLEPRPASYRATAASASLTADTETLPTESFESTVHLKGLKEPDDKRDVRLHQPGTEKSIRAHESATSSTTKNPILERECIKDPPEVKVAKAEKHQEDPGAASLIETDCSPPLEAWSLRHSSLESKLRFRIPFRGTSVWTRLRLKWQALVEVVENIAAEECLWNDLALLSDYQKKQIDRLISMRQKQDNHGIWGNRKKQVDFEIHWVLEALNSHPRNVRNGCIVNLVVVIGRTFVWPSQLGLPPPIRQASPEIIISRDVAKDPDTLLPKPKKVTKNRDFSSSKFRRARSRSYSRGRKRDSDSRLPYQSEDSSDDSWTIRPDSKQIILAGSNDKQRTTRASTRETANNPVNQMLQKWTNLDQATKTTQAPKKRQRRSEKRKQMEKDGYVSLSDDIDCRTFIVGDQVQVRSGNSRNRDSNAKPRPRWESPYYGDRGLSPCRVKQPKKARSKIGEKETTMLYDEAGAYGEPEIIEVDSGFAERKKVVDIMSRERELEEREKNLARRERTLLGIPTPVGPANVEAEAQVHVPRYSSSVESVDHSV